MTVSTWRLQPMRLGHSLENLHTQDYSPPIDTVLWKKTTLICCNAQTELVSAIKRLIFLLHCVAPGGNGRTAVAIPNGDPRCVKGTLGRYVSVCG